MTETQTPALSQNSLQKYINDPIHKYIHLSALETAIVDTPQFFRLRALKQLGSTYLVFPGATHSRFEHSLGTAHMAESMISHLHHSQSHADELDLSMRDHRCVKIAGLCHDLGHGPFSHVFDGSFIPLARPGCAWTHEQASEMLFDHLVDDNGIELDAADCRLIKGLIAGDASIVPRGRRFLFDIVANKRNCVDVDKFDYINRDCYYTGIKSSYDPERAILMSKVIDDQVCYSHKEALNLYEMFHMRYSLFKRIYTHKVSKAIEYMLVDIMLAADSYFQLSQAIDDPVLYARLTDDIIPLIQCTRAPELEHAQSIIERLHRRQLYKFVDEVNISSFLSMRKEEVTAASIISYASSPHSIRERDVIVEWLRTTYGKGDDNPMDSVRYYGKWDDSSSFTIPREQLSLINIPQRFSEVSLRIYTRDASLVPSLQKAFRAWAKANIEAQSMRTSPERLSSSDCERVDFVHKGHTVPYDDHVWTSQVADRFSPGRTPESRVLLGGGRLSGKPPSRLRPELAGSARGKMMGDIVTQFDGL